MIRLHRKIGVSPLLSVLFVLLSALSLWAENCLRQRVQADGVSRVFVLSRDAHYLLPLAPVVQDIFRDFPDSANYSFRIIRELHAIRNVQPSDLIITGAYTYKNADSLDLTLTLKNGEHQIRGTCVYHLTRHDASPHVRSALFDPFRSSDERQRLFKTRSVLSRLRRSAPREDSLLFQWPAVYNFINRRASADQGVALLLKEILTTAYGVHYSNESADKILLTRSGDVHFTRRGITVTVPALLPGQSPFPKSFTNAEDRIISPVSDLSRGQMYYEHRSPREYEVSIIDSMKQFMEHEYPRLFFDFDRRALEDLFADKERNILTGHITEAGTQVRYTWHSRDAWFNRLDTLFTQGARFVLDIDLIRVFEDNLSPGRYWALFRQKWATLRKETSLYNDVGFLLLHLDYNRSTGSIADFKIQYRIWVYDYAGSDALRVHKQKRLILRDLDRIFTDDSEYGITGIEHSLKAEIRRTIIDAAGMK
ncbi:MAG: hypothetical protein ACQEQV_06440 [Fibrobacterota bacterium]